MNRHDDTAGIAGASLLAAAAMVGLAGIVSGAQHVALVYGPPVRAWLLSLDPSTIVVAAIVVCGAIALACIGMEVIESGREE